MAARKEAQIWTVRNASGQFLAAYRAQSRQSAITRFVSDQAATASTFRRSQPTPRFVGLTASVEKCPD
jgi:hypothetical protein